MQFLLVRHCETDWNKAKRLQGHTDIPLNDYGREQALALARELVRRDRVVHVISSDLSRAIETAQVLVRHFVVETRRALSFVIDRRLRECSLGSLEGRTWEDIRQEFLGRGVDIVGDEGPYDFTAFGGERRADVLTRQISLLDDVVRHFTFRDEECVLLVGHGSALNTLLLHFNAPTGLRRGEIRSLMY